MSRPAGAGNSATAPSGCFRSDGQKVPCSADLGWWSATYDCYLQLVEAAPQDADEHAGEGRFRCDPGPLGWGAGPAEIFLWLPLDAAGPDPAVLAQQAVESMRLRGIAVGTAPPAGAQILVNAPVWLWAADPAANTWGPVSATASAGGTSVTATARARTVAWDMGDGTTVSCGQGTPYVSGGAPASTPCSHTYRTSGSMSVTATTSWDVSWTASDGRAGTAAVETSSATVLDVREARARITDRS